MNIQALLKQLLLVMFLYSSSTSCAPLIALLCGVGSVAAPSIATGVAAGALVATKEGEIKFAHAQAIARNEQQALTADNAKLTAQCQAMKKENDQLTERRAQLAQGLSLMSEALAQERQNRAAIEHDRDEMSDQLTVTRMRNTVLQRSANFHRTMSRGTLGVVCLGACIGAWNYQRSSSRNRKKMDFADDSVPPISPIGHQSEIPDISHHHPQTGDQSHQMRLRYDG